MRSPFRTLVRPTRPNSMLRTISPTLSPKTGQSRWVSVFSAERELPAGCTNRLCGGDYARCWAMAVKNWWKFAATIFASVALMPMNGT